MNKYRSTYFSLPFNQSNILTQLSVYRVTHVWIHDLEYPHGSITTLDGAVINRRAIVTANA